jgi:hypothetical protein
MKTITSVITFLAIPTIALAQPTRQQSIDESQPGWYKVYHFKGAKEIKKMENRVFSIAQLSLCDSFANWMQASYLPKAGIGDIKRIVYPQGDKYSPYKASWPQGYGAVAYTWNVSYNNQGKLERIPETESPWGIEANAVPGWPIHDLSTTSEYFFTLPSFERSPGNVEEVKKTQDISQLPAIRPYIYFWLKSIEGGGGSENVLLCKGNKSPFIKLTKGQYLQQVERGIMTAYQREKEKIHDRNSGNSEKNIAYFMKYLDEKHAKRISCLKNNKAKYQDRLSEPAEVFTAQPDVMLENFPDVFEGEGSSGVKYPVYKVDPAMYELCKKDKPQWILISWSWSPSSVKEKHMHESIINNFDFDYVYSFFFSPEKVKGQPYTPKRSPVSKEVVVETQKSDAANKASVDKNVHFFDDFSGTGVGAKPSQWYAKANGNGMSSKVATVGDVSGNWAVLEGNSIRSNNLKKPVPANFTLTFDVIVHQNFTWGAKALTMTLAKEKGEGDKESFIQLRLRPGFSGRNGEAALETKFPAGYLSGTKWYAATGFSNDKKVNRTKVIIKKQGETLQLFLENNLIAAYDKGIPADPAFNALSFEMISSDNENDKYYVSNIKITRD